MHVLICIISQLLYDRTKVTSKVTCFRPLEFLYRIINSDRLEWVRGRMGCGYCLEKSCIIYSESTLTILSVQLMVNMHHSFMISCRKANLYVRCKKNCNQSSCSTCAQALSYKNAQLQCIQPSTGGLNQLCVSRGYEEWKSVPCMTRDGVYILV